MVRRSAPPAPALPVIKSTWRRSTFQAAKSSPKLRRMLPRPRPDTPQPIPAKPIRPPNSLTAEMWEDYRIFKAAGLLKEWRRKWAAYLPD